MQFDGRARVSSRIDMAPLVDVVFLLLIFFLLTSSFVTPRAIGLDLPGSSTARAVAESPITVSLLADGSVRVGGIAVSAGGLSSAIAARITESSSKEVAVQADEHVDVAQLLSVLDAVREGGGESVALMAESRGAVEPANLASAAKAVSPAERAAP